MEKNLAGLPGNWLVADAAAKDPGTDTDTPSSS
jgi:hypothetical protein